MEDGQAQKAISIKVIYEKKGKIISSDELSFGQFAARLVKAFRLKQQYFYRLSYKDNSGDFINVQSEDDFYIFLKDTHPKKMYLDQTRQGKYHFMQASEQQEQYKEKIEERLNLVEIFRQKQEYIQQKMFEFQDKIKRQMQEMIEKELKEIHKKGKSSFVHSGVTCSKCRVKDDIKGARFQCIKCNYNLCQECQANDEHIHPLIKILDESQALSSKNNTLMYDDEDLQEVLRQRRQFLKGQKQWEY